MKDMFCFGCQVISKVRVRLRKKPSTQLPVWWKKSHLVIYLDISTGVDKLFPSLLCMWLSSLKITKKKGQTAYFQIKKEICLWIDLLSRVSGPPSVCKNGLSVGCCQQKDWQVEDNGKYPLGMFFPHQDLFFNDTYTKPWWLLIAKIKTDKYILVTEMLSSAKCFPRCWSTLGWHRVPRARGSAFPPTCSPGPLK